MSNGYVPIGIDHGTTNSAIAAMDSGRARVVSYNGVDEVMPSAVYFTERGRKLVGMQAREAMLQPSTKGQGYTRYKLRMGQDDRYDFAAARKVLTAPQMAAEVLAELLGAYAKESGEGAPPRVCVITVPAKFDQAACDATREAARLAGLLYAPLLQEPIAAALACGFDHRDQRAQWVVFDLGGGTLDISLLVVRDGQLRVPPETGHTGDNNLGGGKFDVELMRYVVGVLRKRYALGGFSEHSPTYRAAWSRLMLEVESAKIALSTKPDAVVEVDGVLCQDEAGKDVIVEVPIARTDFERMIAADVEKAVHLCQSLISANRLTPRDINRLILVGGPTKMPYVQRMLRERLGIELDMSVDPMTAVAQGAAIHAATIVLPDDVRDQLGGRWVASGGTELALEYEPSSKTAICAVDGQVKSADPSALSVEVHRTDGLWSSDRIPVGVGGEFSLEVALIEGATPHQSTFRTTVVDQAGRTLVSVEEPKIWYPLPKVAPQLANSLGVAVKGNEYEPMIKAGATLPAKGRAKYRTLTEIRRGNKDDILTIAVLEGVKPPLGQESNRANCHFRAGTLSIKGDDAKISSNLPIGTAIEVELVVDESRQLHATAHVPLLDEDFEALWDPSAARFELNEVDKQFTQLQESLDELRAVQRDKPIGEIHDGLETLARTGLVDSIRADLDHAKDEREAALRAYKRTLELAGSVHYLEGLQRRVRIERDVESLRGLVSGEEVEQLKAIERELHDGGSGGLEHLEHALRALEYKVRTRPHFDLMVDLAALSGMRVTSTQHQLFIRAEEILDRVSAKGGVRHASDEDLREMQRAHDDLASAHDDLFERRQKFLDELPPGSSPEDIGRHIERA